MRPFAAAALVAVLILSGGAGPLLPAKANGEETMETLKRRPPGVAPVVHEGTRYEVELIPRRRGIEQTSGVVTAYDDATGAELWTIAIYPVTYDSPEEDDVEDVFITALSITADGESLLVTNERGERFSVSLADHSVTLLDH